MLDLIGDGTLPVEAAALLWALLARRASIVVAAGPSGAGKTTLLTALLDFLPPGTRRLYLRGCYEPFAFLDDPTMKPDASYLLVNEISAHLPVYLWGPGVRRLLQAAGQGFGLAATMHARSTVELVQTLTGYPLRVPAAEVAAFQVAVILDAWLTAEGIRREVRSVAALVAADAGGLRIADLVSRSARGGDCTHDWEAAATLVTRPGGGFSGLERELAGRAACLETLRSSAAIAGLSLAERLATLGQQWVPPTGMH